MTATEARKISQDFNNNLNSQLKEKALSSIKSYASLGRFSCNLSEFNQELIKFLKSKGYQVGKPVSDQRDGDFIEVKW